MFGGACSPDQARRRVVGELTVCRNITTLRGSSQQRPRMRSRPAPVSTSARSAVCRRPQPRPPSRSSVPSPRSPPSPPACWQNSHRGSRPRNRTRRYGAWRTADHTRNQCRKECGTSARFGVSVCAPVAGCSRRILTDAGCAETDADNPLDAVLQNSPDLAKWKVDPSVAVLAAVCTAGCIGDVGNATASPITSNSRGSVVAEPEQARATSSCASSSATKSDRVPVAGESIDESDPTQAVSKFPTPIAAPQPPGQ